MRTFEISWGSTDPAGGSVAVSTVEEVDAVLDRVEGLRSEDGLPFLVSIFEAGSGDGFFPYGMQVGLGHPERARVVYFGEPAGGIGYDPDLPEWAGGQVDFDLAGIPTEDGPEQLRVTPAAARRAVREYVTTGQRPTCVSWETSN